MSDPPARFIRSFTESGWQCLQEARGRPDAYRRGKERGTQIDAKAAACAETVRATAPEKSRRVELIDSKNRPGLGDADVIQKQAFLIDGTWRIGGGPNLFHPYCRNTESATQTRRNPFAIQGTERLVQQIHK